MTTIGQTGKVKHFAANLIRRLLLVAFVSVIFVGIGSAKAKGHNWALLIGTGNYQERKFLLEHTDNDIDGLASALVVRGNYDREKHVKRLYDVPGKELLDEVTAFLTPNNADGPQKNDQVLVYFTGHGFKDPKDKDGTLYLAPMDFKVDDPKSTGIDVKELYTRLKSCPAKSKILIIDSCYAGNDPRIPAATDIERNFDGLEGVVTLASSMEHEESLIGDKGHSVFTYWLIQAVCGHADTSMDGEVTFDELYAYVHKKVSMTAATRYGRRQTPVASMRFSSRGFPTIIKLKPLKLDLVLEDMAQQIISATELQNLNKVVSVPPFLYTSYRDINDRKVQTQRADKVPLGLTCANRFHEVLETGEGRVKVETREQVHETLTRLEANELDFGTYQGTNRIAKYLDPDFPPVVVYGELLEREPGIVQVRARAIRNDTKATLIETGGTAEIDPEEHFEAGNSVIVREGDYEQMPDPVTRFKTRGISAIHRWHIRQNEEPHPLDVTSFPFRIKILVRNTATGDDQRNWITRVPEFIGQKAYVALDVGEEYRINVEYRDLLGEETDKNVFLKLLVDGLSIREGEQRAVQGVSEREIKTRGVEVLLQNPISLEKSKVWILRPLEYPSRNWTYKGFYLTDRLFCPFIVCDASESRGLADQIGIISAVFYKETKSRSGQQGTKAGIPSEAEEPIRYVDAGEIGAPIASVHIHYVSRQELDRLKMR